MKNILVIGSGISALGACKLALHKKYNVSTNIIRPFNIYGPGISIETDYRMIPNLMKSALRMQPVHIYGNGNQTRTFCYQFL